MATVPGNATIEEELYDAQVKYKSITVTIAIDNIEIFVNLDEKALKYGRYGNMMEYFYGRSWSE